MDVWMCRFPAQEIYDKVSWGKEISTLPKVADYREQQIAFTYPIVSLYTG